MSKQSIQPPSCITGYVTSEIPLLTGDDDSYELTPGRVYKLTLDQINKTNEDSKKNALIELAKSDIFNKMMFSNTMTFNAFVSKLLQNGVLYVCFLHQGKDWQYNYQKAYFNFYDEKDKLVKFAKDETYGMSFDNDDTITIPIEVLNKLNIYPVTQPPVTTSTPPVTTSTPPQQNKPRGRSGIIRSVIYGKGKKSIKRKKIKGNTRLRRRFSVRRKNHN
jgi:hypothetical protein